MEGVILFADDKILSYSTTENSQSPENKLYKLLAENNPVLGLKDRDQIQKTINSVGVFTAIILDWQYDDEDILSLEEEDDETVKLVQSGAGKEDKTYELLMRNEFYSLIYIYSSAIGEIEAKYGETLRAKFKGRIVFRDKLNLANTQAEATQIIEAINSWKQANKVLDIPISWSYSINKSVQSIFSKLNQVDPFWMNELYKTAMVDGVTPSIEVINMFQNILSEKVIRDKSLQDKIDVIGSTGAELNDPIHYAELMRILYYAKSHQNDPIMTGDMFRYPNTDDYCIILTPECDLRHIAKEPAIRSYEILKFSKGDFKKVNFKLKAVIKAKPIIDKAESFKLCTFTTPQKTEISQELNRQIEEANTFLRIEAFTQTNPRYHLLPCFEFEPNNFSGVAVIDFRFALSVEPGTSMLVENRIGRLNTPYIQEIRQRFLSYKGRVGVPGYSKKLQEWLLNNN